MGGVAKGLLKTNGGETILARQLETVRSVSANASIVLVGSHLAYADSQLPQLADDPPGIGPMGGLRALMKLAQIRGEQAVALACDMPCINAALLERLLLECVNASALAPRM